MAETSAPPRDRQGTARAEALRGHAAMLLFAALVSVSFTLGHMAAPFIAPEALTAARFLVGAVIIGALAAPRMRAAHLAAPWRYLAVGGLLAGYFVLMFQALRLTDPVSTGAVFTLTPIMSAVFGWLLMRQVTTPLMAVSLLLAGAGAIWVVFRADIGAMLGMRLGAGERIFFVGCAMHALYAPLGRWLHRGEPVLVYTFGGICGGLAVTLAWGARDVLATDWAALPAIAWAAVFYLAVFATATTFFLVQYATLRLPSAKVMAYGYLVPSFVILWEGLLGHGWVAPPVWLGVVATMAALLILLRE
jgi:drug/metabolite transporter (DMT)-like permease